MPKVAVSTGNAATISKFEASAVHRLRKPAFRFAIARAKFLRRSKASAADYADHADSSFHRSLHPRTLRKSAVATNATCRTGSDAEHDIGPAAAYGRIACAVAQSGARSSCDGKAQGRDRLRNALEARLHQQFRPARKRKACPRQPSVFFPGLPSGLECPPPAIRPGHAESRLFP